MSDSLEAEKAWAKGFKVGDNDLAVVRLEDPVDEEDYFFFDDILRNEPGADAIDTSPTGPELTIQGYPMGTVEGPGSFTYQMVNEEGTFEYIEQLANGEGPVINANTIMTPGASGSPVYIEEEGEIQLVGVLAGSSRDPAEPLTTIAPMTHENVDWILDILGGTGPADDVVFDVT